MIFAFSLSKEYNSRLPNSESLHQLLNLSRPILVWFQTARQGVVLVLFSTDVAGVVMMMFLLSYQTFLLLRHRSF